MPFLIGLFMVGGALLAIRRGRRVSQLVGAAALLMALPLLAINGYALAMSLRPLPEPIAREPLYGGVTYTRDVRPGAEPLVIHVVEIDLTHPDVRFFVTPPDDDVAPPYELAASTTSDFLAENGVQVAINAGFFNAARPRFPWQSPLPESGDPVDVMGVAASAGQVYSQHQRGFRNIYLSADNHISLNEPHNGTIYNALAGFYWFLRDGLTWEPYRGANRLYYQDAPRTVVAVNADNTTMWWFVVDGRQPGYSVGVDMLEMAAIVRGYGAHNALNLDGGGSSTLVVQRENGAKVLNSPVHRDLPGLERPVANHLGLFAPPVGGE